MAKPTKYMRERMLLKNRPRKVLNLEERVQAIQMYDRNPVYQRVASAFKCSWEQIKNVVSKRDEILQYYAHCQTVDNNDNPRLVRQKKINFLGNVMYEFIKRAHYHRSATLTDDTIRERALQFRDCIGIEKFYPNRAWVNDFKHVYNIDLSRLNSIVITKAPQKSLKYEDIIAYCTKEVERALTCDGPGPTGVAAKSNTSVGYDTIELEDDDNNGDDDDEDPDEFDVEHEEGDVMFFGDVDDEINEDEEGPTISYGDYEYNEELDELLKPATTTTKTTAAILQTDATTRKSKSCTPDSTPLVPKAPTPPLKKIKVESHSNSNSPLTIKAATTVSDDTASNAEHTQQIVQSYAEALNCLRPLENFAIYEEDFRAINLLAQLAEVYEKAVKRKRTVN